MTERPILFSGPMVRALLAGTKTQTRRVVKPRADKDWGPRCVLQPHELAGEVNEGSYLNAYCAPGDRLWVRETWGLHAYGDDTDWHKEACTGLHLDDHVIAYRADWGPLQNSCHWRPSIHMPRAASRITLEITSVRVERLQNISVADAIAEGINVHPDHYGKPRDSIYSPVQTYRELWESINGAGSWETNPWVWAIDFNVLERGAA